MPKKWRPRISIEITEEQYRKKGQLIPWGQETKVIGVLLDGLLKLLEDPEIRASILSNILVRNITARHVLRVGGIGEPEDSKI